MGTDWTKPDTISNYADVWTETKDRDNDLAVGLDPAILTSYPTGIPTNSIRWSSALAAWQKYNGTSWGMLASSYGISITGSSACWTTGRTLTLGGDLSGSVSVKGDAAMTLTATLATVTPGKGGTGLTSYAVGDLLYASGTSTLAKRAIGSTGQVLSVSGGAPSWVDQSSLSVGSATAAVTATHLAGGAAGALPYQSGAGATALLAAGAAGYVLTSGGAGAPAWTAQSSLAVGSATTATTATHIAGGGAGRIPYQTGSGATAIMAAGTSGQVLLSGGTSTPTWANQSALSVGYATSAGSATSATSASSATTVTGTVASGATGTTQTAGDNSTKIATTAYADAAAAAVSASTKAVPVRQTVLSGPVDSSGLPSFGGSAGSTSVTASGSLVATAANGFGAAGAVDRVGSISNPSWTGLSTNGTMYLYLDINSDGTCTTGSTTLAPNYQFGGSYSTTNNQATFNIQEQVMKVGNGSSAAQAYRVFVGEVTVASGVVSAITWYALMGRYRAPETAGLPNAASVTKNHNIGCSQVKASVVFRCTTADGSWAINDTVTDQVGVVVAGGACTPMPVKTTPLAATFFTSPAYAPSASYVFILAGTAAAWMVPASWAYSVIAERAW